MSEIKNITIMLRPHVISEFSDVLPNLVDWLKKRKKRVLFLDSEADRLNKIFRKSNNQFEYISKDDVHANSDLIISLGGDGTLIGIARQSTKNSPPIFGVNMGRLGFITEFSKVEFFDALTDIIKGKFEIIKLSLYQAKVKNKEKIVFNSYFLNDIVLNKSDISRMFTLSVEVDSEHVYNLSGDGLIISGPIGSTAYSLAAGGPIIQPKVKCIALTPICPHSLTHRPLIITDESKISVKVNNKNAPIDLTLDGQELYSVKCNEQIHVEKSKTKFVKLIINKDRTYFHTLKEKFTHGRQIF